MRVEKGNKEEIRHNEEENYQKGVKRRGMTRKHEHLGVERGKLREDTTEREGKHKKGVKRWWMRKYEYLEVERLKLREDKKIEEEKYKIKRGLEITRKKNIKKE